MVPVAQGILAGIGFMIFGVPSPLAVGHGGHPGGDRAARRLAARLGAGRASTCCSRGAPGPALGLLVYCTVIVSGSDNVVKPLLLRGAARIHPLLGFLSIIGGVLAFGVFGFLIGPVILSLVLSAIRIYRLDVLRVAGSRRARRGRPARRDRSHPLRAQRVRPACLALGRVIPCLAVAVPIAPARAARTPPGETLGTGDARPARGGAVPRARDDPGGHRAGGLGGGYWLDGRLGTRPVFLLLGGTLGRGRGALPLLQDRGGTEQATNGPQALSLIRYTILVTGVGRDHVRPRLGPRPAPRSTPPPAGPPLFGGALAVANTVAAHALVRVVRPPLDERLPRAPCSAAWSAAWPLAARRGGGGRPAAGPAAAAPRLLASLLLRPLPGHGAHDPPPARAPRASPGREPDERAAAGPAAAGRARARPRGPSEPTSRPPTHAAVAGHAADAPAPPRHGTQDPRP